MILDKNIKQTSIRNFFIIVIGWSAIIGISLILNIKNEKNQSYELALNAARAYFNKDEAIRNWATKHGGVYVPPTKSTPPNPYLAHLENRDVVTQDGRKLTLMNPAYMIREMMDDYTKLYGISGRITGLVALNPNNISDEWESKAIKKFISGETKEVIELQMYKGEEHLRLIKPFYMKPGCVKCHGHLGFKDKDVRGGIGISIPMNTYTQIGRKAMRDLMISHTLIFILGLLGIVLFSRSSYKTLRERKKVSDELYELNISLDAQVKTRTGELEKSLSDLTETQTRLIETEKMSSLGSLVAGVAHEINTPIGNSLTGTTQIQYETNILKKALEENTLGKNALIEYLDTVAKVSESMFISLRSAASLVRSFKQVAIDQHVEEKRYFNLKEYSEEVLLSLHSRTKKSNVNIINNIEIDISIYSYAGIFYQIITNFIINSLVHAFEENDDKKGEIVLSAKLLDKELIFIYEDNGSGIKTENINKIFDPFFTTKLGQGGSGLGLNIIYNLINHKLGGKIECVSENNNGTKMIIKIPMSELVKL